MGRPLETWVVVQFSTAPAIMREAFAPLGGFEFRRERGCQPIPLLQRPSHVLKGGRE